MAEELHIDADLSKEEVYEQLYPQLEALIGDENDLIANLANVAAAIHTSFSFLWTGFYLVKGDQLVLGPFQGPVACTRIGYGSGVCGTSWKEKKSIVVPNVHEFPGHIACSADSNSEIVVPIFNEASEVIGVLDIDSSTLNTFDETDRVQLEKICGLLG